VIDRTEYATRPGRYTDEEGVEGESAIDRARRLHRRRSAHEGATRRSHEGAEEEEAEGEEGGWRRHMRGRPERGEAEEESVLGEESVEARVDWEGAGNRVVPLNAKKKWAPRYASRGKSRAPSQEQADEDEAAILAAADALFDSLDPRGAGYLDQDTWDNTREEQLVTVRHFNAISTPIHAI